MLRALLIASFTLASPQADGESRGQVDWFEGSFAEALEAAKADDQLLLLEFWADWCGWCSAHEQQNLSDPLVLGLMKQFTCLGADLSVDASNEFIDEQASDLMRLFSVQSYPSMIFVRPDGTAEDVITGFLPAKALAIELKRIKLGKDTISYFERMIERHPEELEWRYKLALKLSMVGDNAGYQRELASIQALDPEGTSLPMRRMRLGALREELWGCLRDPLLSPDPAQLSSFLEQEGEDELLCEGWLLMAAVQNELGSIGNTLAAYRRAWKHATLLQRPNVGNAIAYAFWSMRKDLDLEDKRLALRISLRSTDLLQEVNFNAATEAQFLDTLACCYFMNEKYKLALETVQRCLQLDANNQVYEARLRSFNGQE